MRRLYIVAATAALAASAGCGDDTSKSSSGNGGNTSTSTGAGLSDETGEACGSASDCYDGIVQTDIQGEVQCLDRVDGGYCTHLCQSDDDCCAVDGECEDGTKQVCAPFESTGDMMCFLSCENEDLGGSDAGEYCAGFHADFICRSTGGGSDNRKVCVPGGSSGACGAVGDCTTGFENCCKNILGAARCYDDASAVGLDCL